MLANTPKASRALAVLAVSALTLAALPAAAQTTGSANPSASGAPGVTSSGSPRAAGTTASDSGAQVSREDRQLMDDLVHANIAEIETGQMALEKSKNPQVRKFAQQMIDDHTAALKEVRTLGQSKGVELPDGTDLQHKALATALRVMTGDAFDSQYMKRVGINDHERTIELLQKTQREARDPDLKALAAKMLPTVEAHLQMGRQGAAALEKK